MATFFCSLSGSPCVDPVLSSTGYVFERQVILQHLATHGPICPISGQSLTPNDLYAPTIPSLIPAPVMVPSAPNSPVNNGPPSFHMSPQHRATSPDPLTEADAVALDPRRLSHHSGGPISAAYSSSPGAHSATLSHHSMSYAQQPAPGVIPDDAPMGIPRVPSTSSFRSARRQSRVLSHRNSWHESTFDEPSVPSAPSHRESVALNAQVVDDAALVDQLASEDYRYSAALANAGGQTSHDRLVAQVASMPTYRPYFVWLVTALQTAGLVWSLVWSYQRTGQVIATQPFNFMIGPSADVLVQMGARFTGCMRDVPKLMPDGSGAGLACTIPNPLGKYQNLAPGSPDLYQCNWEVMCGDLAGSTQPRVANQWFRFATAMFLHAGVVHFAMNILFQWTAVKSLERDWGWFRIAPVYLLAGLFGFIFGGSFADAYSPSVGCSGALFGMVACLLIDHIQNWRIIHHPTTQLLRMLFVIIITFFLGLFPGIDNFSHVGGFIIGLLMGIVVMPNINLSFCSGSRKGKPSPEAKQDSGFGRSCFSGYSTVSLIARAVCLIMTVALFVAMVPLFYGGNAESKCSWCHYIDCLPALAPGGQCGAQTVTVTQVTQNP